MDQTDSGIGEVTANELLDKIILRQLHLMEEKMCCELNIESSVNDGNIHLAKTRYIMGHSSVTAARLPTENSPDFAATITCDSIEVDGVKQFKVTENKGDNTVKTLHWFGVLVPQNLHKAQASFTKALDYVIECVNIQLQIQENMKNIVMLRTYLSSVKSS